MDSSSLSSGVFHCTHSNGICHTGLLTACKLLANLYDIYHCCVYSEKLLMIERNCPKHIEFYSKNKFEKLVHLVGFIIRLYHDAQSSEHQIESSYLCRNLIHSQNCVLSLTHSRPVHVRDVCCSAVFGCNLQSIYVSWRKCCRHFCKKGNTLHQWCCVNKQIN